MTAKKTLILDHGQIRQKIRRMAYQILENNFGEKALVLAGIEGQGFRLAQLLGEELEAICSMKIIVGKVNLNKERPEKGDVTLDVAPEQLRRKTAILVDDVQNTGRTLTYGVKPLLDVEIGRIEVAVLVNRSHINFPIQPTYTGYQLSTTLSDHVEVVLGDKSAVYLH